MLKIESRPKLRSLLRILSYANRKYRANGYYKDCELKNLIQILCLCFYNKTVTVKMVNKYLKVNKVT